MFFYCIFVFLFSLIPKRSRPWGSNYITVESRCIVIRFYMRLMPCFSQNFLNVSPAGQTLPHEKSRQKSSEKREWGRRRGGQQQWREMVTIRGALNSPSVPSTPQQPKAQAQLLPGAPASTLRRDDLFFAKLKKTLKGRDMMIILRREYYRRPPLKFPNERNLVENTIMNS